MPRSPGMHALGALGSSLLAGAGALWWFRVRPLEMLDAPLHVPLWALAIAFVVAEAGVVDIQLRRDSHVLSLSDIPLVAGLFLSAPTDVLLGLLAGVLVVRGLARRRVAGLLLTLGHRLLGAVVALVVFHQLVDRADPIAPVGWLAAFASVVAAALVSVVISCAAIAVAQRALPLDRFRELASFSLLSTLVNASFALVGVVTAWHDPYAALLLVAPTLIVLVSYRAYLGQRAKHQTLEFLYESSRLLHESQEIETALASLLTEARETFRARVAELVLAPSRLGEPGLRIRVDTDDDTSSLRAATFGAVERRLMKDLAESGERISGPESDQLEHVQQFLRGRGIDGDAMLAPLTGETRPLGILVLGDHRGDRATFDREDLRLFGTLANHVSSSLAVGRLEKSLGQLTELKDELRHRAYHDPLTGLANRQLFTEEVEDALSRGAPIAVLFFDLDDFKTVNDSLGHAAGDELLKAVAGRLRGCLPAGDMLARLGGDEFAALIRAVSDADGAEAIARRIIETMDASFDLSGTELNTHVSVGIALPRSWEMTAADLLRNADVAMYEAKRAGKGTYRRFEPEMHTQAVAKLTMRGELQRALDAGGLDLYLQPIVELATGAVVGAEALVRWDHPDRGMLHPAEFLEMAEETGLVVPLGAQILARSCRAAASWGQPLTVSVNVASGQLHRGNLADVVAEALDASGLPPGRLLLEVTEAAIMHDTSQARGVLSDLVSQGVKIALDDFGTGFSSLEHLSRLPVHLLKVAKPFVDGILVGDRRAVVARGILDLAGALGLGTIGEGIERREQADQLRAWGCVLGQGYLFSHPVPAVAFDAERATSAVRPG